MLQLVLLAIFGVCAVLCFWFRLRIGMLEGAQARGSEQDGAQAAKARWERRAVVSAVASAVSLVACIAVGAIRQFTGL